jgi:hypothetical protein
MATQSRVRNQIRGFVLVWVSITLLMSAATFFAIYLTYGGGLDTGDSLTENLSLPPVTQGQPIIAVPSQTPTSEATEVVVTEEATSVAQLASNTTPTDPPTATIQPTPLPVEDKRFQPGIQVQHAPDLNPENQQGWMNLLNQLQLDWFKQQVRWEDFEPEKGEINWTVLDLVLPIASESGKKVMLSIVTSPEWAREAGADLTKHGPPALVQDYVNFVTAIVERYPGQVHAIEVWNEQNIDREWSSPRGLVAANYVQLLKATYEAVKNIDPGIIIISGALSPTGVSDGIGAWDDFTYMDQLIQAGLLNYTDCVGAHHNGYNIGPNVLWDQVPNDPTAEFRGPFDNPHHSWSFRSTLQTYASKIKLANGDQKLCVTEFGWAVSEDIPGFATAGFEFANDNTKEEQAEFFEEALTVMEEWDIVWLAFIWNLNYGPQAGWDPANDNVPYSLIGPEFSFRPAYDVIKDWMTDYKARAGQN